MEKMTKIYYTLSLQQYNKSPTRRKMKQKSTQRFPPDEDTLR